MVNECAESGGIHFACGGSKCIEGKDVLEAEAERAGEVVFELSGADFAKAQWFLLGQPPAPVGLAAGSYLR